MYIRQKKSWELSENKVTPEAVYLTRRKLIQQTGLAGFGLIMGSTPISAVPIGGFPPVRNTEYTLDRTLTSEQDATTYTNFYEFGSSKNIWRKAKKLNTDPWIITIDGLVDYPIQIDAGELTKKLGGMEERLYRHRCVEAWSMAVPWAGFPLSNLVKFASPKIGAKYIRMETFFQPEIAPGQKQSWYPWPYVEGLTINEARNELAFLAVGLYGKPLPNQNGAPLRLVVPWKYGFKSIKSITRFTFTDERPRSFWELLSPKEYGFWANVNPWVPHPRWPQDRERMLGGGTIPTQLFNGYEKEVSYLYKNEYTNNKRELFY